MHGRASDRMHALTNEVVMFLLLVPAATLAIIVSVTTQTPQSAADPPAAIVLVDGDRTSAMRSLTPQPRSRNTRIAFVGISRDLLTIDGAAAGLRTRQRTPFFRVIVPAGVAPGDRVRLVKLNSRDGGREVGRASQSDSDVSDDALMSLTFEALDAGGPGGSAASRTYLSRPKAPLKPGEYAIVLNGRFYDFGVD